MKLSITAKWYIWLVLAVAGFGILQIMALVWWELRDIQAGTGEIKEELTEITALISICLCLFAVMAGGLWFLTRRMIRPIRLIAESATRISEGELSERVAGNFAEDEVGLLVNALNQAFDRYHDALQHLDRFAGNAAHQLRTPLTSIRSLGEVCLQNDREPGEYRECIHSMLEVTEELTEVVEKLLVLARLNTARIRQAFVTVSPARELQQVVDVFLPAIHEKDLMFETSYDTDAEVRGDPGLMRQAIGNILDNAIQFTPPHGRLKTVLSQQENYIYLDVLDSGPPFPASLCRQIEQENQTGRSNADGLPTGRMGLALVCEILRIHEGTVTFLQEKDGCKGIRLGWPVRA